MAGNYELMQGLSANSIGEEKDGATELQRVVVEEKMPKPPKNKRESGIVKKKTLPMKTRGGGARAMPLPLNEGHQVSVVNSDRQNLSYKPYTLKNVLEDGMCVVESEGRYKMVPRATVKPRDYFPKMKGFYQGWGMCELRQFTTALRLLGAEFDLKTGLKVFQMLDIQSLGYLKFQPFFNWVYGLGRNEDRGRILTTFECVAGAREWDEENTHYVCRPSEDEDSDEVEWLEGHVNEAKSTETEVVIEAEDTVTDNIVTFRIPRDKNTFRDLYDAELEKTQREPVFVPVHGDSSRDISIVVVGGHRVGKSALLQKFVRGTFPQQYDPTIEDGYRKTMNVDNEPAMLHILDTAGQEEFASMRYQWLREVDVLFVCYTPVHAASLKQAEEHLAVSMRLFRQSNPPRKVPVFLVETQTDVKSGKEANAEEMKEFLDGCKDEGYAFREMQTSAQKDSHVEDLFTEAVREYRNNAKTSAPGTRDRQGSVAPGGGGFDCGAAVSSCLNSLCAGYVSVESEAGGAEVKNIGYVSKEKIPDGMPEPVFATRHFSVKRECSFMYFFGGLATAVLFPFVILIQNIYFWFYTGPDGACTNCLKNSWCLPEREYHIGSVAVFADFLHSIVGRDPNAELTDEVKKDSREWFMSQTCSQKLLRLCLVPLIVGSLALAWLNFLQMSTVRRNFRENRPTERVQVAFMEDTGPLGLWFVVWLILSIYFAFIYRIAPDVPSLIELRPHVMYFNLDESIRTTAYVFMRGFAKSIQTDRQRLEVSPTVVVMSAALGILYALVPGITRVATSRPFFPTDSQYATAFRLATFSAIVINMLLAFVLALGIQIQILSGLDNYTEWMEDITSLLDPTTAEDRGLPYLNLGRQTNLVSWMEMRTFLYTEGLRIFARQEVFIFSLACITLGQAIYLVWRLLTDAVPVYRSETFNGFSLVFIGALFSMYRLLLKTRRLESIQKKQSSLLAVQGFSTYYSRLTYHGIDGGADDEFSQLPELPDDDEMSATEAASPILTDVGRGEWSVGDAQYGSQFSPDYLRDSEKLVRDVRGLIDTQEIVPRIFNVKLDFLILLCVLAVVFSVVPIAMFVAGGSTTTSWN